jgi:hypothetical protein
MVEYLLSINGSRAAGQTEKRAANDAAAAGDLAPATAVRSYATAFAPPCRG